MLRFELQPDERPIRVYRQTEWMLLKPILIVFACIYLPWWYLIKYELVSHYTKILFIWTLAVLLYFFNKFVLWLLTSYILTDRRLINIKYQSLIKKQVIETPLERILNIGFETSGLLSSVFNYGDINVQIMGMAEPMVLRNIRYPSRIKDFLWKVHSVHAARKHEYIARTPAQIHKPSSQQAKNTKM